MTRVSILTAKNASEALIFLTPLLVNRRLLKDMGVTFRIFHEETDGLYDADCVWFENRIYRVWGREGQDHDRKAIALLEKLRARVGRVFWIDTTDGTGTTQFHLLPYVDRYVKSQLLADRSAYLRDYYGGRVWTDYYHERFGVTDSDESYRPAPAAESELHKLVAGWNDALADWGSWGIRFRKLRNRLPAPMFYSARFADSDDRPVDVNARFGTRYGRETVAYQRALVKERLAGMGVPTDRVPRSRYLKELRKSKVAVSPFGWGDPCYRDYEAILNGAMLLKPDMSHVETWPDLYVSGETYLPFAWDCSDLADVLDDALRDERWRRIARRAQEVYRWHLFGRDGREAFCKRVVDMVES